MTKGSILALVIAASCMLLSSCLTTKGVGDEGGASAKDGGDSVIASDSEATSVIASGAQRPDATPDAQEDINRNAAIAAFIETIQDVDLVVTSAPAQTTKGRGWAKPFVVAVRHTDGSAAEGFPIMVTYPASRDGDTINFDTVRLETGHDGLVSFMPDAPQFSFDAEVTFTPVPPVPDADLAARCHDAMKSAPFLVRTNASSDGGMIYVWDYGENGKPLVNSAYLLKEIMAYGVRNVGNAPFSSAAMLDKSDGELYRAASAYVKKGFMIYGAVHYVQPVAAQADGKVQCALTAHLKCVDLGTGKILYETEQHTSVLETDKTRAIDQCRRQLAKIAARAIMYGM